MSHRVTVQTEIKEKAHAISALKSNKIEHREQGDTIHLLGAGYEGSSINLRTGQITSGDTDYHSVDSGKLGLLRQAYSEAKFRAEAFKEGVEISDKSFNKNGDIVLHCRMA